MHTPCGPFTSKCIRCVRLFLFVSEIIHGKLEICFCPYIESTPVLRYISEFSFIRAKGVIHPSCDFCVLKDRVAERRNNHKPAVIQVHYRGDRGPEERVVQKPHACVCVMLGKGLPFASYDLCVLVSGLPYSAVSPLTKLASAQ
jgi:hypothetical protein